MMVSFSSRNLHVVYISVLPFLGIDPFVAATFELCCDFSTLPFVASEPFCCCDMLVVCVFMSRMCLYVSASFL